MKNPFHRPADGTALHALEGLLFGLGAAYPLLAALGMPVSFASCAFYCAAAALVYALLGCVGRLQGLFYPLLTLCILLPLAPYRTQLSALGNSLTLFLSGQPLALIAYARPIALIASLTATGVGLSLARSEQSFFLSFLMTIGVLFAVSFSGAQIAAAAMLPLTAALLLGARSRSATLLRLLPCVSLTLLLTFALLPLAGSTVPALRDAAQRVRQAIDDYFFFNDARTAFSLSSAGWQPLGSDRLGGPVAPDDAPVMQVSVSGRALLRGIIKNEYTGLAWQDSTSGRRYLFISPRFYRLKSNLFDQSRPREEIRRTLPAYETIRVDMRADAASTLFLTQRFSAPSGEGIVAYFSPASEVFATHSLTQGERYAFSGMLMTSETPGVRAAVLASLDPADAYYETVREQNLRLPSSVSSEVFALAERICAGLDNDYDRAAAICFHLQNNYPYTLLQNQPPASDFVSWFLLEEKQGYCTSFASAMAVMCRAVGIPARYIEGYAAEPDADGIARVTQQNAHAWTEVYFPGFGWLSFDPTPGSGQSPDLSAPQEGGQDEPQAAPDAPTPSPEGDSDESGEPTPTPTPSATPSPTPTPTPSPTPTAAPTPTPEHDDPSVTPTPEITPTPSPAPTDAPSPSPEPTDEPEDNEPPEDSDWWKALLGLLLLLVLLALAAWRLYSASPAYIAARKRLHNDAMLVWYGAITEALLALGYAAAPGEAPATFLRRVQGSLGAKPNLDRIGTNICIARFSRHKLGSEAVAHAQRVYDALLKRTKPHERLSLYMRRLIFGRRLYR